MAEPRIQALALLKQTPPAEFAAILFHAKVSNTVLLGSALFVHLLFLRTLLRITPVIYNLILTRVNTLLSPQSRRH